MKKVIIFMFMLIMPLTVSAATYNVQDMTVTIDDKIVGKIDKGYCILVGFANDDTEEKLDKLVDKQIKSILMQ